MIDQISEAKSIKELQLSLLQRKSLISTPILSDLKQVNRIYEMFNKIDSYRNPDAIKGSVIQKKRFCFIILRLYSPGTILFNEPLVKGVRKQISQTLGVKCPRQFLTIAKMSFLIIGFIKDLGRSWIIFTMKLYAI